MEEHDQKPQPQSRAKKRHSGLIPYFRGICLFAIALFLYFHFQDKAKEQDVFIPSDQETVSTTDTASKPAISDRDSTSNPRLAYDYTPESTSVTPPESIDTTSHPAEQELEFPERVGYSGSMAEHKPISTGKSSNNRQENIDCERRTSQITEFYRHLDEQAYIHSFSLSTSSNLHFSGLIQRLIDNPPVVSRETDDLFTILQNTAHFFRIVGKNNILLLKGILDQEKDSFEEILADFYSLTGHPNCLKEAFDLDLNSTALYDYAGFFLNTMGGRLYLFRRDSVSRMVVSYYSILIIDQANRHGKNSHGIDIRPAVDILISEIENSGNQLKLKEVYLDKLYELKERYYP